MHKERLIKLEEFLSTNPKNFNSDNPLAVAVRIREYLNGTDLCEKYQPLRS